MKKVLSFALMALMVGFVFVSCDKEEEESAKSYTLSMSLSKADSIYLGTDKSNSYGDPTYLYYSQDITVDPFVLTHSFTDYGFGEGFTYTSCTDKTTPGFMNLSAITGKGVKGNAYFTANAGGYGIVAEITFKDGKAYNAKECYVTNSTYAYLAIKDQNDGNPTPYVKEWTKDDKFTLTITGYNGKEKTGSVDFLLADGLNIVDSWQQVDLSKLGKVTKIEFSMTSTDASTYGENTYMNTPAYFCLDQLKVTE